MRQYAACIDPGLVVAEQGDFSDETAVVVADAENALVFEACPLPTLGDDMYSEVAVALANQALGQRAAIE